MNPDDAATDCDLLIIGGGINGAACAWRAQSLGLRVVLLEKGDFRQESSAGNFKIIHGGLRYLQHLDLPRLYESVGEQRRLRQLFPELIQPFPFLVPCYGYGKRSREFLDFGCSLYDLLTLTRNRGVRADRTLPRHRRFSSAEVLNLAPGVDPQGLRGGVLFYDCQMPHPPRLLQMFLENAEALGAKLLNYHQVVGFFCESNKGAPPKVSGVRAQDIFSRQEKLFRARMVLNTSGPWSSEIFSLPPFERKVRAHPTFFSKGLQIVVPKKLCEVGVAIESREVDRTSVVNRGGKSFFITPWENQTLIGTANILHQSEVSGWKFSREEVAEFYHQVKASYRDPRLSKLEPSFVFGGLRPIDRPMQKRLENDRSIAGSNILTWIDSARHDETIEHFKLSPQQREDGFPEIENLVTHIGVKYTTALDQAEKVIDRVVHRLQFPVQGRDFRIAYPAANSEAQATECRQAIEQSLPAHPRENRKRQAEELFPFYGPRAQEILHAAGSEADFSALPGRPESLMLLIRHCVRQEHAKRLSDVISRRTRLGVVQCPEKQVLVRVANIMAEELSWSDEKIDQEIERTQRELCYFPDAIMEDTA